MTISITGASGDIGGAYLRHSSPNNLIHALVRNGKELSGSDPSRVTRFEFQDGFSYERQLLRDFCASDAVLHCAALLNVDDAGTVEDYFAVNALLTGLLVATCRERENPPKFVYISTEMVYSLRATPALAELADAFVAYCQKAFATSVNPCDLRALSAAFLAENASFDFDGINVYALTKYLGEAIVQTLPNAVILRVTSAYGPDYNNARLIPRLMVARLSGRGMAYAEETRDFVYSADINRLIDTVMSDDLSGTVECKSGEVTSTRELIDSILRLTPTAYGDLDSVAPAKSPAVSGELAVASAACDLSAIIGEPVPLHTGLIATLHHHKRQCYHEMADTYAIEDFLRPGETIVRELKGGSAAYIYVVADKTGHKTVRKVAVRDGVEGNGLAKIIHEIDYYKHIEAHHPKLARIYPRLLETEIGSDYSSETIEYLDGENYYAALREAEQPLDLFRESLQKFVDALCSCASETLAPEPDPETSLDVYYIERALTRLEPIYPLIGKEDRLRINGRDFLSAHVILGDLLTNAPLRNLLLPRLKSACLHGDLTLLNTVLLRESNEIRMIDPRGFTGDWDPLYDFGKLKFSLSGFGEFILKPTPVVTKVEQGFEMELSLLPAQARAINDDFLDLVGECAGFKALIAEAEPHWRYRILLAEATHYLADIPFRLYTDETPFATISNYVLGTYYLNQLYEELCRCSEANK